MNPGRELDALIAEKVMKRPRAHTIFEHEETYYSRCLICGIQNGTYNELNSPCTADPPYSTDIKAAWDVAQNLGLSVVNHHGVWLAGRAEVSEVRGEDDRSIQAMVGLNDGTAGDSAPHAICLAALKAIGYDL